MVVAVMLSPCYYGWRAPRKETTQHDPRAMRFEFASEGGDAGVFMLVRSVHVVLCIN